MPLAMRSLKFSTGLTSFASRIQMCELIGLACIRRTYVSAQYSLLSRHRLLQPCMLGQRQC